MPRSILIFVGLAILCPWVASPQSAPKAPEFDVASIRPGQPATVDAILCENGRLTVYNFTLRTLIQMAWHVRDVQILGGPPWMDSEGYYISAKGDPSATDSQCLQMVQALLKDRFRLSLHNEQKDLPVYVLTVSSHGPKFHEADSGVAPNIVSGKGRLSFQKISMGNAARILSSHVDQPVLDKTGLDGRYTFTLEWDPDEDLTTLPDAGSSLFRAIETQLGLRLDVQKTPLDVVVIDHLERPSPN